MDILLLSSEYLYDCGTMRVTLAWWYTNSDIKSIKSTCEWITCSVVILEFREKMAESLGWNNQHEGNIEENKMAIQSSPIFNDLNVENSNTSVNRAHHFLQFPLLHIHFYMHKSGFRTKSTQNNIVLDTFCGAKLCKNLLTYSN